MLLAAGIAPSSLAPQAGLLHPLDSLFSLVQSLMFEASSAFCTGHVPNILCPLEKVSLAAHVLNADAVDALRISGFAVVLDGNVLTLV